MLGSTVQNSVNLPLAILHPCFRSMLSALHVQYVSWGRQWTRFYRLALYFILFSCGYHSRRVRTAAARQAYGLNHEWESAIVTQAFRGLTQYLEANDWLIN